MNAFSKYVCTAPLLLSFSFASAQITPPSSAMDSPAGSPAGQPIPSGIPTQAPVVNPAAGYYSGNLSNGKPAAVIVIENGQFWLVTSGSPDLYAVIEGYGSANNGTFISEQAVEIGNGQPIQTNLTATYSPKVGMDGSLAGLSIPLQFSMSYDQGYDVPYPVTTVAGNYNGRLQIQDEVRQVSMNVDTNGAISGTLSVSSMVQAVPPCQFSGELVQQSAQTNPYYFAISFADATSCGYGPNVRFSGVITMSPNTAQANDFGLMLVGSDDNVSTLFHMMVSKGTGTGAGTGTVIPAPTPPEPTPGLIGSNKLE
jgi:hypothetical protein